MLVCTWDLESSHLKANFAQLLTSAIKPYGWGKPTIFVRDNLPSSDDRKLLKQTRDELEKYDIIITYYGTKFDLPLLQSRLIHFGMAPLSFKGHIDAYNTAKKYINTHSRRLQVISEFFGIQGKGRVVPADWVEAAYDGNQTALNKIAQHNKEDVEVLEETWELIKHFCRGIQWR